MGNQGCQQRPIQIPFTRRIAAEWLKSACEAAPFIDVLQDVFDPHPGIAGAEGFAQLFQLARDGQRITPLELEATVMHAGKPVARQAIRRSSSDAIELGEQSAEKVVGVARQIKLLISLRPMFLPIAAVVDQIPERDLLTAFGEEQTASTQRTASASASSQMRRSILPFSTR
jgi:hypothetical protein